MLWKSFLSAASDIPVLVEAYDREDRLIFWNRAAELVSGYRAEELTGNPKALEWLYPEARYRRKMWRRFIARGDDFSPLVWQMTCKGGEVRAISWFNISHHLSVPNWHRWAVGLDVTERRQLEEELQDQRRELERQLRKTAEARVALRVLLEQREEENKRLRRELDSSLGRRVRPFLEKLEGTRLDEEQKKLLTLALGNLHNLKSANNRSLGGLNGDLTAMELEVALLVERGKSTTEIAAILHLAELTVGTHRHHIRRKLGLVNTKANLGAELRRRLRR